MIWMFAKEHGERSTENQSLVPETPSGETGPFTNDECREKPHWALNAHGLADSQVGLDATIEGVLHECTWQHRWPVTRSAE